MARLSGAFPDYVRGVLAEQSERSRALRARRARWLYRLGQRRRMSGAEQRWAGEGGSTK